LAQVLPFIASGHRSSSIAMGRFARRPGAAAPAAAFATLAALGGGDCAVVAPTPSAGSGGDDAFSSFMQRHGRRYDPGSVEGVARRALFERRLAEVEAHNARPGRSWNATVGTFADRTDAERAAARGWQRHPDSPTSGGFTAGGTGGIAGLGFSLTELGPMPETVDWRSLMVSSDVPDQAECGSCWAVTTAAVLEAHYEIYHSAAGTPRSFSAQEILACTPNPRHCGGKGGCDGATIELGMAWVLENGLDDATTVPYKAADTACPLKPHLMQDSGATSSGREFGLMGWEMILPINRDEPLARAVYEWGPVGVSVAGNSWHEYAGGIFNACPKDVIIDHAVALYGYGEEGIKYWLIRNTWGREWGEAGFMRLKRHDGAERYCGIDNKPQEGTGCDGGPQTIPVCGMCGILSDSVVPYFSVGSHGASLDASGRMPKGGGHRGLPAAADLRVDQARPRWQASQDRTGHLLQSEEEDEEQDQEEEEVEAAGLDDPRQHVPRRAADAGTGDSGGGESSRATMGADAFPRLIRRQGGQP